MRRTYKIVPTPPGQRGTTVEEFQDGHSHAALWLPAGTSSIAVIDSTQALARAYQHGLEDRSEEILGEAGLARAGVAAGGHEFDPAVGESDWGTCSCGAFTRGSVPLSTWQAHLAYAVLQAAARTT